MPDELKLVVAIDKPYKLDLNLDLNIDKGKINEELSRQPSMYAWYATLYELAKAKTNRLKQTMEVTHAELDIKYRSEAQKSGQKVTEAYIQSLITVSPAYKESEANYYDSKKEEGMLNVAKTAFEQRKDMLISIATNMRVELDDELSVLKKGAEISMRKARETKNAS